MILSDYLRVLRRGWWVMGLFAVLGVIGGLLITRATPPTYYSTSTVYVSTLGDNTPGDLQQGNVFAMQRAPSYAELATTTAVLERAAGVTGDSVAELRSSVTAVVRTSTTLVDITAAGDGAVVVEQRANAVATALAQEAVELDTPGLTSPVQLTLVQPASQPEQPTTPRPRNNVAIGLVVGLIIGVALVVVRDAFDTRIRTVSDLPRIPGLATLSSIPVKRSRGARSLGSVGVSDDRLESIRNLRANLQFGADSGVAIAVAPVTSASDAREMARELGSAFGEIGASVVVVDLDLRPRPAPRRRKESADDPVPPGVAEVLSGRADVDAVLTSMSGGVEFLPAGGVNRDSAQLLSTPAMRDLMTALVRRFDHVILACAPVVERSEAAVAAALSDNTLIVVEAGDTTKDEFLLAMELLSGVRVVSVNVAVDHVRSRDFSAPSAASVQPTNEGSARI